MDDVDTESGHQSHWRRWTGDAGPFYCACAVNPFATTGSTEPGDGRPALTVTSGLTRQTLRHLPLVVLAVLAVYVPASVFGFLEAGRLQVSLSGPEPGTLGLLVPGVVIAGVWCYLVYRTIASPLRGGSLHRSLVFFGTALPLAAGAIYRRSRPSASGLDPEGEGRTPR